MPFSDLIPLRCPPGTLDLLVSGLCGFAAATVGTDWLISAAFLETGQGTFIASTAIEILRDGTVARPLQIASTAQVVEELRDAVPDIRHRVEARGFSTALSVPPEQVRAPAMNDWFEVGYEFHVLVRSVERFQAIHQIACGILFRNPETGERLLIASDLTTPALVLSQDPPLIDLYVDQCSTMDLPSYRERFA